MSVFSLKRGPCERKQEIQVVMDVLAAEDLVIAKSGMAETDLPWGIGTLAHTSNTFYAAFAFSIPFSSMSLVWLVM